MDCLERLQAYLRQNQVPYQLQDHPLAYTAQEVAASEHIPGKLMTKVVIVFSAGETVMLALPAPYHVDLTRAAATLGAREVRLAHEGELGVLFQDCETGAMPPFGNLYDIPVYVDRALAAAEMIVFRAGKHTTTMSLTYADFERLVKPTVAEFAVHD